jgi:tetratricopeptide (TPR) repeat protein
VAEIAPPPTTVVEIAPPPTTVVEIAPPPPSTIVEVADEGDEAEEPPPSDHPRTSDPQWLVDRANFRRSHGDLPGAEADYLQVLRSSPNNARAQAGLARLHLARHDARTASTWARRLAEGHSPNAGNYVLLGDTLQATGDSAGARRAWERALEITPGYRDARRRLGR